MSEQLVFTNLLLSVIVLGLILSFVLQGIFNKAFRFLINRINFPRRIKTEDGYLYRAVNGVYASKDRCFDLDQQWKMKNKERWIARHQRIIKQLQSDD